MFIPWTDFDRNIAWMDELRRQMGRLMEEFDTEGGGFASEGLMSSRAWPRARLLDAGANLVLKAELPGLKDKDLKLSIHDNVLTLSGTRPAYEPEGYTVHRHERAAIQFSRSFPLPVRVNSEKTSAEVQNGILSVTLPKHAESLPREISVKVG
jgi:HSP20 family protein